MQDGETFGCWMISGRMSEDAASAPGLMGSWLHSYCCWSSSASLTRDMQSSRGQVRQRPDLTHEAGAAQGQRLGLETRVAQVHTENDQLKVEVDSLRKDLKLTQFQLSQVRESGPRRKSQGVSLVRREGMVG